MRTITSRYEKKNTTNVKMKSYNECALDLAQIQILFTTMEEKLKSLLMLIHRLHDWRIGFLIGIVVSPEKKQRIFCLLLLFLFVRFDLFVSHFSAFIQSGMLFFYSRLVMSLTLMLKSVFYCQLKALTTKKHKVNLW